jgi:hypothetical protein
MREQGMDPDETWQELASYRERLSELGIPLEAAAAPVQQSMNFDQEADDAED